jgi:hypothetical protein
MNNGRLENEIMNIIDRFGALEFQNQYDIIMNGAPRELTPREQVNLRLEEYMTRDGEIVDANKKLATNVIVTSPTQSGKTKYMIDMCKSHENRGELIVMSCDNSKKQEAQLKDRLREAGVCSYSVTKASSSVVGRILRDNRSVVLVMLNNASQISKLNKLINELRFVRDPTRYVFFHDEADMLNKSDEVTELTDSSIAISHRSWVSLMNLLEYTLIPVNRFWISATPENCSSISRIYGKDILVLPEDENYRGVTGYTSWSPDQENAGDALEYEINRIREIGVERSGEVILYCVDRKNINQDEIAREISINYNCVTLSYNMKDLVLYFNGRVVRNMIGKNDNISVVLDKTREICRDENSPMVVVGYNLMSRGVSFVAQGVNPPTATVMFYSGGVNTHAVAVAQLSGRITGTSRPDLVRRHLYCLPGVYQDYKNYLGNQEIVWNALGDERNREKDICSILLGCGGAKINRPIDRPALVSVNLAFREVGNLPRDNLDWDEDKMHRLVDSWKLESNGSAVSLAFRKIWNNGGRLDSRLVRECFANRGPYDALTSNHVSDHNLIFRKDERYHYIRDNVIDYLG